VPKGGAKPPFPNPPFFDLFAAEEETRWSQVRIGAPHPPLLPLPHQGKGASPLSKPPMFLAPPSSWRILPGPKNSKLSKWGLKIYIKLAKMKK